MADDVGLIKQALCFRAKYRFGQGPQPYYLKLHPMPVVPHPRNRSGEPVKSLRTRELSGTIAKDGADADEANLAAICIMDLDEPPHGRRSDTPLGSPRWRSFQEQFEKKVELDIEMAISSPGFPKANFGSLSHGHFNCTSRNAMCGKKGCECQAGTSPCTCANKPIIDSSGNYDMQKIKEHDLVWYDLIAGGLVWEVLDCSMDVEEPDAARLISVALNRRTAVAMKTSPLEIWSALRSLCKPDPTTGGLAFEPVKDQLIRLFGFGVDQCGLSSAFQLIMDVGGGDSAYLVHLQEFTDTFVNPKKRKLKWDTYTTVAEIPIAFPNFKIALLLYTYKQTPQQGWCVAPPSLAYRFWPEGQLAFCGLLEDMEVVMSYVRKCATAVAAETIGKTEQEHRSRKAKITATDAELDIALVKLIVDHPKKQDSRW